MITEKSVSAYKTISEVSKQIDVPSHVLRFWETKFGQVKPIKRSGGRRYYRSEDIDVLVQIRTLLYKEGYTIKGAKKVLKSYLKTFSLICLGANLLTRLSITYSMSFKIGFKSLLKFIDPKALIKPFSLTSKLVLTGIFLTKSFELPIKTWSVFFIKFKSFISLETPPPNTITSGSIVFISSAGLFRYPPGDALSVAPKATIEHLIKGIAKEEGVNGVRANSIALGVIDAGIFHRLLNEENTFFDEAWHEAVLNNLALKRFGQANEVSETALFLASSKAAYITGHCIPVDGGYHL